MATGDRRISQVSATPAFPRLNEHPGHLPMTAKHALHPDLSHCVLEDRTLLAGYVWMPMPFIPINTATNSMVMTGFSAGSGGASTGSTVNPGANAYYLMYGINTNLYGLVGQSSVVVPGGYALSLSVLTPSGAAPSANLTATVGSGPNSAGNPGGSGGSALVTGYSGSFSSGYSTSLNNTNNYGATLSPVGSIPVNTYGGDRSAPAPPAGP